MARLPFVFRSRSSTALSRILGIKNTVSLEARLLAHSLVRHRPYLVACLSAVLQFCSLDTQMIKAATPHSQTQDQLQKLLDAAWAGDLGAMVSLGEYYRDTEPPEFDKAAMWFHKAVDAGSASAMERMGGMYRDGYGVERDYGKAMQWYKRAMDAGDLTAIASIGWLYYHGLGVQRNELEALRWYQLAADKGGHEGMNNLGHLYLNGIGVDRNIPRAIELFEKSAKLGNTWAYDNLGVLYLDGTGVKQNRELAITMFQKAAEIGLVDSMVRLGRLERDLHDKAHDRAAFEWFQRARGSPEGMRELGECYFDGVGVAADAEMGLKCYECAIRIGHPSAVVDLSNRIRTGHGIEADPQRADAMLVEAASQGVASAATKLGHLASEAGDYQKANQYYRQAAEQGESVAELCLAIEYHYGQGVEKDEAKASEWLNRSAEHGSEVAQQLLNERGGNH